MKQRLRIVLDSAVDMKELGPITAKYRWWIRDIHKQDGDKPAEIIYVTRDNATAIHWIDDLNSGVKHIMVTGPATEDVVKLLQETLSHWSSAAIMKRARKAELSPAERGVALHHLASDKMERGFDQETFDIYANAMRDADPIVRKAAVRGSALLAWPQLAEPMRALATQAEPDESIRNDAATLVGRLEQLSPP